MGRTRTPPQLNLVGATALLRSAMRIRRGATAHGETLPQQQALAKRATTSLKGESTGLAKSALEGTMAIPKITRPSAFDVSPTPSDRPPNKFKLPDNTAKYDGTQDPKAWIEDYLATIKLHHGTRDTAI